MATVEGELGGMGWRPNTAFDKFRQGLKKIGNTIKDLGTRIDENTVAQIDPRLYTEHSLIPPDAAGLSIHAQTGEIGPHSNPTAIPFIEIRKNPDMPDGTILQPPTVSPPIPQESTR